MNAYRIARQIAYFRPDDDRGKWHAAPAHEKRLS